MFSWLRPKPKPPLDAPQKLWIERRMTWLAERFGVRRLRDATVVVPTPEFFPDPYAHTEADGLAMFRRVCSFMGIDPGRPELSFVADDRREMVTAAGLYVAGERPKILVRRGLLGDPVALVATFAHELAHDLLLPTGYLNQGDWDHEYVTDLLVVYLGLGVFAANSHIQESHESFNATWYSWSIGRQGYLSERMHGYALALLAWLRNERSAAWMTHLRANVRDVMRNSVRYLERTGDTQFRETPDATAALPERERLALRVAALDAPSSGARLASLWDLKTEGAAAAAAVPALIRRLGDDERFVRVEAAEVLGNVGPAAEGAVADLIDAALREGDPPLARAATVALGRIGQRPAEVVPTLLSLLSSPDPLLERSAVIALAHLGPDARAAVDALAERLARPDSALAAAAAKALGRIGPPAANVAIPALVDALENAEHEVPVEAARALGSFDDPVALAAIRKATHSRDPEVTSLVREILNRPKAARADAAPASGPSL